MHSNKATRLGEESCRPHTPYDALSRGEVFGLGKMSD